MVNCSTSKKYKPYFIFIKYRMLVIPEYYFYNKDLTSNDKIILMLIYSFNRTELLTTTFIADELWLTSPTVRKSLKELEKRNLIIYNDKISKIDYIEWEFVQQ